MKEKVLKRLTKKEINDPDPAVRNQKLRDAIQDNEDLNMQAIRLVDDSQHWRGWIVSYLD